MKTKMKLATIYAPRSRKPNSKDRLKKSQLALYLEPGQFEALKILSGRTRVPQQVYLREGLDMVLAKYKKELQR